MFNYAELGNGLLLQTATTGILLETSSTQRRGSRCHSHRPLRRRENAAASHPNTARGFARSTRKNFSTASRRRSITAAAAGARSDVRVKDIPGFEGFYAITDCGHLLSLYRQWHDKKGRFTVRGSRVITRNPGPQGYTQVWLRAQGLPDRKEMLHRLVAIAFLGEPEDSRYVVNHKDGNKNNNHINNLEWCDHRGNRLHHLLNKEGVRVTAGQIREVHELADELPAKVIAERLGIPKNSVYRILYHPKRRP
jgi:hypothetical protein